MQYPWSLCEGLLLDPCMGWEEDFAEMRGKDRRCLRNPVKNTVPWLQWWPTLAFPHVPV